MKITTVNQFLRIKLYQYNFNLPKVGKLLLSFLGRVAYCRGVGAASCCASPVTADFDEGKGPSDTTDNETKSPDLLIRSTTCSCEAVDTSSPFICKKINITNK